MSSLILRIYDFFRNGRRALAFLIPLVLCALFVWSALGLRLDSDIAAFLPYGSSEGDSQSQFVYQNLRKQDKVVGIISLENPPADKYQAIDRLAEAADEFACRFQEAGIDGVKDPLIRIDAASMLSKASFIARNMPYFLDSADYRVIDSVIASGGLEKALEASRNSLISTSGLTQDIVAADPFGFTSGLMKELSAMGAESGCKVIGDYLYTPDSLGIMVNFSSEYGGSETGGNAVMLSRVYAVRDSTIKAFPDVKMEFTGSPVIAVMNAQRMKKDALVCACVSMALIILLLSWYFRRVRPILMICVPVVFGILAGLAFMGVFKASISAVALSACCVILGIAVDYSLLYSTRLGFTGNSRAALSDIASPMVIGNITTVGAFLSLLVMSASGMRDFGLFSAVSLVGAILFVVLFMPHWVKAGDYKPREGGWMGKWAGFRPEENRWVFWAVAAVTVVLFFFSRKVTFSGDFTKINYMAPAQQELLDELSSYSGNSGALAVYAVSQGGTLDEAIEASEKNRSFLSEMVSEGKALSFRGTGPFLPSSAIQHRRLGMWNDFVRRSGSILEEATARYGKSLGFSPDAFDSFISGLDSARQVRGMDFFSEMMGLMSPYMLEDSSSNMVMDILYVPEEKVDDVYGAFASHPGKAEGSFLFDSFSMTDKMIDILQADFDKVLAICSILVFIFLWIAFRRLELALTAFLPMVVSWIWITGIMGIFGISFNIVNIILATFIFGLGDDYTIFMVEGLQYEHTFRKPLLSSYKTGVTLSALTMFVGIGSLVFAVHPALNSLGAVAVIGMTCVVVLAFVLPPVLFRFLVCKSFCKERSYRVFPVRLSDILVTLYCVAVFAFLCLVFKLRLIFSPNLKGQALRTRITRIMRFFCKGMPRVKMDLVNWDKASFDKTPRVLISNHQSHLDLMYFLSLSDKIVVVTNKWVFNSPVYGGIVRRCGNVCVEDGLEANKEKLLKLKEEGCSVLIFPEGTRSADCSILKFRSGAFSMAKELDMELLPVILFGPGEVLPKGEHILRRGKVVMEFKPAVMPEDLARYGVRPLKQAQNFCRYYQKAFADLKEKVYSEPDFKSCRDKDFKLYKSGNEMV